MKRYNFILFAIIILISCNKSYQLTDPLTNQPIQTLTTDTAATACQLISIQQINGHTEYNKLSFKRDISNQAISMQYYDSITNTIDYSYNFKFNNDTIQINANSWMIRDAKTKNIIKYATKENITDTLTEDVDYTYSYDAGGRLTRKLAFYNDSNSPDYISNYSYNGDNLTSCKLYLGDGTTMLMQTTITYDATIKIKPWINLYGDAFENYDLLHGFSFGNKPTNPVTKMDSRIFDANTGVQLDEWVTNFGSYVYSTDNYVLQVTASGDIQQGLGIILGTMRFYYQCKN